MNSHSYLLLLPAAIIFGAGCGKSAATPGPLFRVEAAEVTVQAASCTDAHEFVRSVCTAGRKALEPANAVPNHVEYPVPGGPGAPFYANFFHGFLPNDGTTVGLAFFRDPSCVRPDFNLLHWADSPAAFDCPLVPGFSGRQFLQTAGSRLPYAMEFRYRPVIYFVGYDELLDAVADGALTIGELNGLASLRIGDACRADQYTIHSFAPAPVGDGKVREWFSASGRMRDGGTFVFAYEASHHDPEDRRLFRRSVVSFDPAGQDGCTD